MCAPQGPLQGWDRTTETAAAALPPPRCSTSAGPQQRSGPCQQRMVQAWDAAGRPYGGPAPGPAWAEAPPAAVKAHVSGTEGDEEAEEGSLLAFVESLDYDSFANQLATLDTKVRHELTEVKAYHTCVTHLPSRSAHLPPGNAAPLLPSLLLGFHVGMSAWMGPRLKCKIQCDKPQSSSPPQCCLDGAFPPCFMRAATCAVPAGLPGSGRAPAQRFMRTRRRRMPGRGQRSRRWQPATCEKNGGPG